MDGEVPAYDLKDPREAEVLPKPPTLATVPQRRRFSLQQENTPGMKGIFSKPSLSKRLF